MSCLTFAACASLPLESFIQEREIHAIIESKETRRVFIICSEPYLLVNIEGALSTTGRPHYGCLVKHIRFEIVPMQRPCDSSGIGHLQKSLDCLK